MTSLFPKFEIFYQIVAFIEFQGDLWASKHILLIKKNYILVTYVISF